mmetsp:Transcript_24350/g.59619  ORF Transcript_24350/g.59619 Transcript_24350/m.59619 type:complete len:220 (+) Transcript_24350:191-850(+)
MRLLLLVTIPVVGRDDGRESPRSTESRKRKERSIEESGDGGTTLQNQTKTRAVGQSCPMMARMMSERKRTTTTMTGTKGIMVKGKIKRKKGAMLMIQQRTGDVEKIENEADTIGKDGGDGTLRNPKTTMTTVAGRSHPTMVMVTAGMLGLKTRRKTMVVAKGGMTPKRKIKRKKEAMMSQEVTDGVENGIGIGMTENAAPAKSTEKKILHRQQRMGRII